MSRYIVYEFSQSGHCCFDATVVDSTKPSSYFNEARGVQHCEAICECFEITDAQKIADALNKAAQS